MYDVNRANGQSATLTYPYHIIPIKKTYEKGYQWNEWWMALARSITKPMLKILWVYDSTCILPLEFQTDYDRNNVTTIAERFRIRDTPTAQLKSKPILATYLPYKLDDCYRYIDIFVDFLFSFSWYVQLKARVVFVNEVFFIVSYRIYMI